MADWDENSRRLYANLIRIAERLARGVHVREAPATNLALRWHEEMLAGLDTPDPDYVGRLRGVPPLDRTEVRVGDCWGTPAAEVPAAVERFLARLSRALRILDDIVPVGSTPSSVDELNGVLTVCARAHGDLDATIPVFSSLLVAWLNDHA